MCWRHIMLFKMITWSTSYWICNFHCSFPQTLQLILLIFIRQMSQNSFSATILQKYPSKVSLIFPQHLSQTCFRHQAIQCMPNALLSHFKAVVQHDSTLHLPLLLYIPNRALSHWLVHHFQTFIIITCSTYSLPLFTIISLIYTRTTLLSFHLINI